MKLLSFVGLVFLVSGCTPSDSKQTDNNSWHIIQSPFTHRCFEIGIYGGSNGFPYGSGMAEISCSYLDQEIHR